MLLFLPFFSDFSGGCVASPSERQGVSSQHVATNRRIVLCRSLNLRSLLGGFLWLLLIGTLGIPNLGEPSLAVEFSFRQDLNEQKLQREEDSTLIDGLRRRRLFDLAELHCQTRLSQAAIDPTSEAHLTIELIKTRTAKAILTPTIERAKAWDAVGATATEFSANAPDHPRRLLVEVQLALSHLTHAKMIRQEIAAEMVSEPAEEKALNEIRAARSLLNQLEIGINQTIPELRGRSKTEYDMTIEQLLNLKNNLRLQLAKCNLIRSQLYAPEDRLNRAAALGEVKQQLGEVQRVTSRGKPLWWSIQLGQLECLRLLSDSGTAKLLVDSLPTEIPAATQLPLLEQKIRLAIEMGNKAFSQQVFEEYLKLPVSNPQLDLALVELASDLSARATSDELKKQWLDYASGFARKIESDHGGYWGRRADLVLIRAVGGGSSNLATPKTDVGPGEVDPAMDKPTSVSDAELEQLIRLGENTFRKNNLDDSIKAYQQAQTKSRALGDSNRALQLGMIIGQIFEKQSKPNLAAKHFIESAMADVGATSASAAHLRGCWNLASDLESKTELELAESLTYYRAELGTHLKLWPQQPTADHARLYLAARNQRDHQWQSAFDNYLDVRTDSPHFPIAIKGLGTSARQLLAQTSRDNRSTINLSSELVSALNRKRSTTLSETTASMHIEILMSELETLHGGGASNQSIGNAIATRLEPLHSSCEPSIAGSSRAIRAALLSSTQTEVAKDLIAQLDNDRPALKLCQRCLESVVSSQGSKNSHDANQLRLEIIDKLLLPATEGSTTSSGSTGLLLKKSKVLSELNRHAEAILVLEELKTAFPRNAGIQMQLARCLTAQHQTDQPNKPLDHWRRLLRKLKSHSPNWYEAKYHVAKLLHETGQSQETVKLLKLLRDVGPGWNESELKSEFESLLNSAQRTE